MPETAHSVAPAKTEAGIQAAIRLEAAQKGAILWRNTVGATPTPAGGFLRYGLANDTKQLNARIKSADLIGIRPRLITQPDVGNIIGQFMSREIKKPGWKYSNSPHEQAQLRWCELITSFGGDACFASSIGTIDNNNNTP